MLEQRIIELYTAYHEVPNSPESEELLETLDTCIEDLAVERDVEVDELKNHLNKQHNSDLF